MSAAQPAGQQGIAVHGPVVADGQAHCLALPHQDQDLLRPGHAGIEQVPLQHDVVGKDLPYLRIGPRFDYAPKIHRCFLERHICGNSSTCLAVLHLPQYAPRHPSHFCQGHFSLHCSFSMAAHLAPIRTSNFSFLETKSSYVPFTSFIPDVKSFLVFISLNRNHYFFNYLDKLFFYSGKILSLL